MALKNTTLIQRNFEEATHPILELLPTVNALAGKKYGEIDWKKQTFFPRHKKFTSDLVGVTGDGQIIHIEQETSPGGDFNIRMIEYATLISVQFGLKKPLYQYAYYTGDEPRKTGVVEHKMGWFLHKYYFLDAGSTEVCERLIKAHLPTAVLSLLVRKHDLAEQYSAILAERIAKLLPEERPSMIAHCMRVASLRGRGDLFETILMGKLKYDPTLFNNPAAEAAVKDVLSGWLPDAVARLPFSISPDLNDYILNDMSGWEINEFLKRAKSFGSEDDIMDTLGIERVAKQSTSDIQTGYGNGI
ncbi:hypothetical protein [Neorhizobium galegae]|uniref:hypothetical protein n=1 Tax=Neorhizobium galegae TaxID=399 RepID=UPI0012771E33|nr:hypothetical protein [Neorhizobium galegae]KAA9387714.1 hypothetical protein F4V88_15215 [Neorhizobium galegae]MCM2499019.1 hypothetical protein [Neorhizobium galegae]MCQ1772904.1 hypothetical protein [Neorhizobium galegae]MCQ1799408.1 hypothetical protein [Neorhizobium galegae]